MNESDIRLRIKEFYEKYYNIAEIKAAEENVQKYRKWFLEGDSVPDSMGYYDLRKLLQKREDQIKKCIDIYEKMEKLNLTFKQVAAILSPRKPEFCLQALRYALNIELDNFNEYSKRF